MLFRKKEKEQKPLPEDATTFQKLMHNKKTRSAMILGLYMFGILILILFINLAPKPEPFIPQNQTITFEQKQENLINSSYNFEFEITTPELNINFRGEREENIITGFKRIPNEAIIEFKIEDGVVYNTLITPKEEIPNFFAGINPNYLDLNYIFNLLTQRHFEIIDQEYIYQPFIVDERTIEIKIITDRNDIIEIELKEIINEQESIYNLKFTNIVSNN